MDKLTKLSQAIRYGSTFLGETTMWMRQEHNIRGEWDCGCALGTAYLALNGVDGPMPTGIEIMPALAERFDVPLSVLEDVSCAHYLRKKTRAQCADWLESLGY